MNTSEPLAQRGGRFEGGVHLQSHAAQATWVCQVKQLKSVLVVSSMAQAGRASVAMSRVAGPTTIREGFYLAH